MAQEPHSLNGNTLLHDAINREDWKTATRLINQDGADVTIKNNAGESAYDLLKNIIKEVEEKINSTGPEPFRLEGSSPHGLFSHKLPPTVFTDQLLSTEKALLALMETKMTNIKNTTPK